MNHIEYQLVAQSLKNLQVGNTDIIGNKFNGHNLHFYLRERGVDSKHLVWNKESKDENTFELGLDKPNKYKLLSDTTNLQGLYQLNGLLSPFSYDVLYSRQFLEADIVHYHLINELNLDLQLMPLLTKLKPSVWTLHDPWALSGRCIHHFDCMRWEKHCHDCPYLDTPYVFHKDNTAVNFELKKQAICNSQLHIIVASKWMKDQVERSPVFENKQVHLVPFGVDQNIFKPTDKEGAKRLLSIPEDNVTLLVRCDYSKFKGVEYIEYIINHLQTDRKIMVITLKDKLKIKKSGVKIREFGWIKDDKRLAQIYNASDMLLMPSNVESFGMMAAEAMCCGTLPIVLEGTALPEVVYKDKCGVSAPRDKDSYLRTVKYYIENDKERVERSAKCHDFASIQYDKENYIDRIMQVYEKAIQEHKLTDDAKLIVTQFKKYMMVDLRKYQELGFRNKMLKFRYEMFVRLFWFKYNLLNKLKNG